MIEKNDEEQGKKEKIYIRSPWRSAELWINHEPKTWRGEFFLFNLSWKKINEYEHMGYVIISLGNGFVKFKKKKEKKRKKERETKFKNRLVIEMWLKQ